MPTAAQDASRNDSCVNRLPFSPSGLPSEPYRRFDAPPHRGGVVSGPTRSKTGTKSVSR